MTDYIDTREGWRRMRAGEVANGRDMLTFEAADSDEPELWVHEPPGPALPSAPYTVIRVSPPAKYEAGIPMLYVHDGTRYAMVSLNSFLALETVDDAADFGIEVLAEPREITMEHVLNEAGGLISSDSRKYLRAELGLPEYRRDEL